MTMAPSPADFALRVHNIDFCIPYHPLWMFAAVSFISIFLTCTLQYAKIGLGASNKEWEKTDRLMEQIMDEDVQVSVQVSEGEDAAGIRMVITLSESWTLPESKLIMVIAMVFLCIYSSICFIHPYITGLACISASAIIVVVITNWERVQHQVASIFLAAINSTLQFLMTFYILRHEYELWYVLFCFQLLFAALFLLFVLIDVHLKELGRRRHQGVDYKITDKDIHHMVKEDVHHGRCTMLCLYTICLPFVEGANLFLFFVTMFFVYDPIYYR